MKCCLARGFLVLLLGVTAAGCGSESSVQGDIGGLDAVPASDPGMPDPGTKDQGLELPVEPLEIAGSWVDDFGGSHVITDETWTMGDTMSGVFHISRYDNGENWLVAQNDGNNAYSPNLWSRFDWTEHGGELYNCQTVFDGASEQDALDATPADPTDPTTAGCQGFAWSKLTAK